VFLRLTRSEENGNGSSSPEGGNAA